MTKDTKIRMYESFFHKLSTYCMASEADGIKELVCNADRWSYASRERTEDPNDETKRLMDWAFRTLCNTPETDRKIRRRQRANQKNKSRT